MKGNNIFYKVCGVYLVLSLLFSTFTGLYAFRIGEMEVKDYDEYFSKIDDPKVLIAFTYADNQEIKASAIKRIGVLKIKEALSRLYEIILPNIFGGDKGELKDARVQIAAVWAIGQIGDPNSVQWLIEKYNSSEEVFIKIAVIEALANFPNNTQAKNFLISELLQTKDSRVAVAIGEAFLKMKAKETIVYILEATKNSSLRAWARDRLSQISKELILVPSTTTKASNEGVSATNP